MLAGLSVGFLPGLVPDLHFRFPAKSSPSATVVFSAIYLPFRPNREIEPALQLTLQKRQVAD